MKIILDLTCNIVKNFIDRFKSEYGLFPWKPIFSQWLPETGQEASTPTRLYNDSSN